MQLDTNSGAQTGQELPVWAMPATLRQLAESGDSELVEELMADFQADTAERLAAIETAIDAANYSAVNLEAHTIKGGALEIGAGRVAHASYQLELAAKKVEPRDLLPLFRHLLSRFKELRGVLAARSASSPPETPPSGPSPYGE